MRLFPVQLTLMLAALSWHAGTAAAHGPAPSALSIILDGADGPDVVRLTGGLARRVSAENFQYLCPAAWGDQLVLPAASIPPSGPVVIAGSRGLFLLDASGAITMHPDPLAATAPVTDFAVLGDQLFALRTSSGASELLQIDASRVRVLFSESGSWSAIAATEDTIGIQRVAEGKLEQLRLGKDGALIGRDSAPAPQDPLLVLARATKRSLYAVVATASGRELGQIDGEKWQRLEMASSSIAGPVELPSGEPFIALDTELFRLSEQRVALGGMPAVNCLARLGDRVYACTRDGLAALEEGGVGKSLFQLSSILPPDLQKLPESQRDTCQIQWEHFRFDLLALGVMLQEPPLGAPPMAAGSGGAAGSFAGGAGTGAGSGGGEREPPDELPAADSGCSCRAAHSAVSLPGTLGVLLVVGWARSRIRRRSARSRA